jgi:hypothetical protein
MNVQRLLPLVTAFAMVACDDDSSSSSCERLARRERACGVLSEGVVTCNWTDPANRRFHDCVADCLERGSCSQVREAVCGDEVEDNAIIRCANVCRETYAPPRETYTCNDGAVHPLSYRCDGEADCAGGEDELDCPEFTCRDGQVHPLSYRCDRYAHCVGGEDEANCPTPPQFRCANGDTVKASSRCDGGDDCADASDELGCAQLLCE